MPQPWWVLAPIRTDVNGSEAKIDWPNSYDSVIGMMLCLSSNTRPDIYLAVHQCARFTNNNKVSHETAVKRTFRYLQGTKDNGLVFNPSKKLVVDCYADAYFAGLWVHEYPQDPICARSRTGFVVTFSNSTPSTNRVLRIFMSPQSCKILIGLKIHHQFLGWIKH